ncbi:phage tail tape measure protein, TP901 family, core region [Enterococcus sp. 8G7_MSG3316]|uniref:Phage tail tape measure protein, TP901 family, core region n=1 Tax=Candidatus Enterococcus testudinis TaxID=1834191 RepID=A0A242A856_9ENTE|nr:phage tail tape measure protein [Enterococcus sp. 8G7_MSG3316]OTN77070.1 phage tail tape measure protein, TP901 family, core region [Enterococcus sp. 8G7_MSG3316]
MAGATPLGNMVIKLGLDDADFGKGVANSKKQVQYLAKEMQANMKVADLAGNKLGKLGTRYDGLTQIIKAQENQVSALKKAYDESFVDGKATDSTKRLAAQLQDANGKLANYKTQLQNTAGAIAEYKVRNEGLTGSINKTSDALIKNGENLSKLGSAMTKSLTLPIAAGAAAVTKAAISWESAFAGVKKTSDEVVDSNGNVVYSYDDLEASLRGLAKELPSTHSEIAAVAEAAGQLGIQTDNVAAFTKVMIDLGESTNMGAETAATELARFANITQMSQDKFSNLGSAIVDLGNNFATTESEISAMALRLAGAGSQIGMSEGDIVGFAAALSSVGIEAEAGGSAFSKVMVNMQLAAEKGMGSFDELIELGKQSGVSFESMVKAVQDGGKNLKSTAGEMGLTGKQLKAMYKEADEAAISLQQFADVAGMTNSEFGNLFKENPAEAIMAFVDGLAHAEEKGKSAIAVLDDMDIKEVRLRDSLLRAANASGVFAGAVEMGNTAFGENTALAEEAGKRYETTESKLKMLKNEVVDAAIDLGGPFVDALREGLETSKPFVEQLGKLAQAFSDADPKTQKMVIRLLAATAAAGPLLSITGKLSSGVGKLGKSFIDLSANMAKKKAIDEVKKSFADGDISAATFLKTLSGGSGTVTKFGAAASGAAGSSGIGAMAAALGPLGPLILGIVGVGGALAVGYGAWKLFGEEAWNSSQRVQRWGADVGEAVDGTLTKVQNSTQKASGQFGLMADGFTTNSDSMISNFEKIGQTIEDSLVKKVEGLDKLIKELPNSVNSSVSEMVEDEKAKAESALQTVQDNTSRITEIKKAASNSNREISVSEAKIIQDLAKNTTQAYVETLDVSASEKKKILSAMNADVANATQEEAKLWLQSLGEQRRAAQENATLSRQEKEKYLEDLGYNLDGEFAKKFLSAWDEINATTVQGFDSQMETILKKYPELQNEVSLANGQLISSMGDYADSAIAENEKILKSASDLSRELASNAEKNAEKLSWTASESSKAGKLAAQTWNDLVFDEKTGEVKSNVAEVVTEATKDSTTWNNLKLVVHDADLDSNAKDVVGEAAIANGWWDGMAWSDKKAILDDEFSQTMYKALEDSGKWKEMSFDEKKAFLYSNTPEVMAETMLQLGLWEEFQPQIKDLKADNYELLNALSFSKTSLNEYNALDPEIKKLIAEDPATLTVEQSKKMLQTYNDLSPELKRLLGENTNVNSILTNSQKKINDYNATKVGAKHLHATADYSEVERAKQAIAQVYSKNVVIDVEYRGRRTGQTAIPNASGTNYHPGGDMIVNDQSGPLYKEIVQFPGQAPFIPHGRNVYIPNAPVGAKVYKASRTKSIMRRLGIPKYADGVGIPEDSSLVRNLRSLTPAIESSSIKFRTQDYSKQFEMLIDIMSNFGDDLRNMQLILDGRNVMKSIETRQTNQQKLNDIKAGRRTI